MANDILTELKEKLGKKELLRNIACKGQYCTFYEIASILLNKVAIRKGDKTYYIKDIEFYLYNDFHRDIITYPRKCEAGQWYFHSSGVDISFESYVKTDNNEYDLFQPILDKDSFFGGILIRQIYPADKTPADAAKCRLDGPHKVEWELFDKFDAFNEVQDFPHFVACEHEVNIIKVSERRNILPSNKTAEEKVKSILDYNYYKSEIPEDDLVKAFKEYKEATYRYTI